MQDLVALVLEHAVVAAIGFASAVIIPAALLYLRKKAKETPNKVDDAIVDRLIEASNRATDDKTR